MRIDNLGRPQFDPQSNSVRKNEPVKRSSSDSTSSASASSSASALDTESRAARIESLKQMFAAGQPIDVNKLASKLVESGLFANES